MLFTHNGTKLKVNHRKKENWEPQKYVEIKQCK